jgi:hypothetical protein
MIGHPLGLDVAPAAIGEVGRERHFFREPLKEAGQRVVAPVAVTADDLCPGEQDRDQPERERVLRVFVDDADGVAADRSKRRDVARGEVGDLLRRPSHGVARLRGDFVPQARNVRQFAGAVHAGVAGQDLLGQGGARSEQPDHEYRQLLFRRYDGRNCGRPETKFRSRLDGARQT